MKAIGYVRVSTDEQSNNGCSLAAQKEKLKAYAALYDIELIDIIEDAGLSAKSLNRPGLQNALQALRSGKAKGLLIAKLDRLTRSVSDWQTLIDDYFGEKAGKSLFSVADSIDTRSSAGRLVLNVLLSVAQWEREAIGERTRDALQHKRTRNERVGTVPFGYDLAADGVSLLENEPEQKAIVFIHSLREQGKSFRAIADELKTHGIRTKAGEEFWQHTTVRRILERSITSPAAGKLDA